MVGFISIQVNKKCSTLLYDCLIPTSRICFFFFLDRANEVVDISCMLLHISFSYLIYLFILNYGQGHSLDMIITSFPQ